MRKCSRGLGGFISLEGRKIGWVVCPINIEGFVVLQFTASDPAIVFSAVALKMDEIPIPFSDFPVVEYRVYDKFLRAVDIDGAGLIKSTRGEFLIVIR